MRKTPFITGEIYHIFNRGVDKRDIFLDKYDLHRFLQSMKEFNSVEPIGSIYLNSIGDNKLRGRTSKLVEFICYCLNPNHPHIMIKQIFEGGISEFMKRLGGYTYYFNAKYKRNGHLFQGKFKSVHISSNEQLLHTSAYINLNNRFGETVPELSKSSWEEYIGEDKENFCKKDIILAQFRSLEEYKQFALSSLEDIKERKLQEKEN